MKNNDEINAEIFEGIGNRAGEEVGRVIAGVVTAAATSAITSATAGTAVPLTVGPTIAPIVKTLGAAKLTSLPAITLFLSNPVGAAVVTGALISVCATTGGKFFKWLLK
jgi:hypothetical protein